MVTGAPDNTVKFRSVREIAAPPSVVWRCCTTASLLEQWWSPPELRTRVLRLDARQGGAVVVSLRYLPTMLTASADETFRAAGLPITLRLRGRVEEFLPERLLFLRLALEVEPGAPSVDSSVRLEIEPAGDGARVALASVGLPTSHWIRYGRSDVEGRLARLAEATLRAR